MTLHESDMSEADLAEVRDRGLVENYQVHDVGVAYLRQRLADVGYRVIEYGDDRRDSEAVLFSDGTPDLKITDGDGETVRYVEVKTKRLSTGPEWFGRLNKRHWNDYLAFADREPVDTDIWFGLVEEDTGIIHRQTVVPVRDQDQIERLIPDIKGNDVLQIREQEYRSLPWLFVQLEQDREPSTR